MKKYLLLFLVTILIGVVPLQAQNNSVVIRPIILIDEVETSFGELNEWEWIVLTNYSERHPDDNPNLDKITTYSHPNRRQYYPDEIHNNLNETVSIFDVKDFSIFQNGMLTKGDYPEIIEKNNGNGTTAKDLIALTTFDVTAHHGIENMVNDPFGNDTLTFTIQLGSQYHLNNKPLILRYHSDHYPKDWEVLKDEDVVFDKDRQTLKITTDHLCVFALVVKKADKPGSINGIDEDKKVAVNTDVYE